MSSTCLKGTSFKDAKLEFSKRDAVGETVVKPPG
ncbi:MAG: hypothetical protein EXQ99_07685 [Alphaproteobacteria bacterium]|nr:hypothetical protein [Alphaproteobacteria bacterium]